jgi:hypothetical protein
MSTRKLKGIVLDETFNKIKHDKIVKSTIDAKSGEITYWTDKSVFVAKKRGLRYWEIWQLHGASLQGEV